VATGLDLPESIHLTNQPDFDVRTYALQIVSVNAKRAEIDEQLEKALVDWQVLASPGLTEICCGSH